MPIALCPWHGDDCTVITVFTSARPRPISRCAPGAGGTVLHGHAAPALRRALWSGFPPAAGQHGAAPGSEPLCCETQFCVRLPVQSLHQIHLTGVPSSVPQAPGHQRWGGRDRCSAGDPEAGAGGAGGPGLLHFYSLLLSFLRQSAQREVPVPISLQHPSRVRASSSSSLASPQHSHSLPHSGEDHAVELQGCKEGSAPLSPTPGPVLHSPLPSPTHPGTELPRGPGGVHAVVPELRDVLW